MAVVRRDRNSFSALDASSDRRDVASHDHASACLTLTPYRRTEDATSEAPLLLDGISGYARRDRALAPDAYRRIPVSGARTRTER